MKDFLSGGCSNRHSTAVDGCGRVFSIYKLGRCHQKKIVKNTSNQVTSRQKSRSPVLFTMGSISPTPTEKIPSSIFSNLPEIPPDEPFSVNGAYIQDTHPKKVNLGIGVYRNNEGLPWPLPVVEKAEATLYNTKDNSRHEYLSIQGDREFLRLAADLIFNFGKQNYTDEKRVSSIQTVSGTGANRLGAEFLARNIHPGHVWIPDPTWANHHTIWELAGVKKKTYPYYDDATGSFNFENTMEKLSTANKNDIIILHACAHNPTGADPSQRQWEAIARLCKDRGIIPFFDLAYQGFASGDAEKDAWAIRHFFQQGLEFCVAQSFSKNFGLYGQRVGALHVVTSPSQYQGQGQALSEDLTATLCHLVRGEYSMAPRGGAEIVRTVLGNKVLRGKWGEDLTTMSSRILEMRRALYGELVKLGTPGDWTHVLRQVSYPLSFFLSFLGRYSEAMVNDVRLECSLMSVFLRVKYWLFVNGIISIC